MLYISSGVVRKYILCPSKENKPAKAESLIIAFNNFLFANQENFIKNELYILYRKQIKFGLKTA